jgi:ERF superfamily protein
MDLITQDNVEQFARLAIAAGWEWCGVQESIPPILPALVIRKHGITRQIEFDLNYFDPIKTATLYLAPTEKKMTDTPKLNLRQKLIQIYNELDHVDKMGDNTKQHYKFVRAADVMRPIRAAFAKWGIYAEPNFEYIGSYDIKTNSGGNMHTATVKAVIVLFDADSDETKTISGLGDGADSGDKGIFKAQTGALKNALRNGTLLPDEGDPNGGDPEADSNVDERTNFQSYTHPASTTEIPDFQEAQRQVMRPTAAVAPKTTAASAPVWDGPNPPAPSTETRTSSGANAVVAPLKTETAPAAAPERGDAYEEPEVQALPTESEMADFRQRFTALANDLSTHGKLTASRGLKLNTKLLVFFLSITNADAAKNATKAQWENFFERVNAAVANPAVGLVGLTTLVNRANGIEPKQK